jgi:hypothetical protein
LHAQRDSNQWNTHSSMIDWSDENIKESPCSVFSERSLKCLSDAIKTISVKQNL